VLALLEISWLSRHLFIHRYRHHPNPGHPYEPHWDADMAGLNHGAEGCAVWDNYDPDNHHQFTDQTVPVNQRTTHRDAGDKYSFSIPTSSARYHFASWGQIDKSRFEVVAVKSDKEQIVVEVETIKDPRGVARVCALPSRGDSEIYGVGFYSPRTHGRGDESPAFKVTVYIPVASDGSQRQLQSFETRLGQFEHVFPDLSKTINFSQLSASAANVPMLFESVVATAVSVHNANSPISGKLTSATDLVVTNANGEIRTELTLTQGGNIKLTNANSPISAQIHLKAGDFYPRPDYHLTTSNANGPIDVTVLEQPVGSGFFLKGSSVMSAVRVHLNAAFEGAFKLSNVFNQATVKVTNNEDPAGRGRERYVQFDRRGSTTSGQAGWGSPDAKEHAPGNIEISNVGAPLELFFD